MPTHGYASAPFNIYFQKDSKGQPFPAKNFRATIECYSLKADLTRQRIQKKPDGTFEVGMSENDFVANEKALAEMVLDFTTWSNPQAWPISFGFKELPANFYLSKKISSLKLYIHFIKIKLKRQFSRFHRRMSFVAHRLNTSLLWCLVSFIRLLLAK